MKAITNEAEYNEVLKKIDIVLAKMKGEDPNDPNYIAYDHLCDLLEDYEAIHYPLEEPSLIDVIKLKMFENKLTQNDIAKAIEVSPARLSEYLNQKRDITIEVARNLHFKLNIDSDIILNHKVQD